MGKKVIASLDCLSRYWFFRRLLRALEQAGYQGSFLTNRLSVRRACRRDRFPCELVRAAAKSATEIPRSSISESLEVRAGWLTAEQAEAAYRAVTATLEKMHAESPVEQVLLWNGFRVTERAVADFARAHGIPTLFLELANIPGKLFADPQGVNARSALAADRSILGDGPLDEQGYARWRQNYLQRANASHTVPQAKKVKQINPWFWLDSLGYLLLRAPRVDPSLLQRMKLKRAGTLFRWRFDEVSPEQRFGLFALQVSTDTQILINSDVNNLEAIARAAEIAAQDGLQLWVKPHPAERDAQECQRVEAARDKLGFQIVEGNTFELIGRAERVFTINSTVGLEAMIIGKPLTVMGRALYQDFEEADLQRYVSEYLLDIDYFSDAPIPPAEALRAIARSAC